jgi:hypothetical protein
MCRQAYDFQYRGFWLLEKSDSQLPLESSSCHLRDCSRSLRDPKTLDNATQGEVQRYKNSYKALNLTTTALGRNVYDRISHIKTAHDVWFKLCNTYDGSSKIKSSCKDTYNISIKPFLRNLESS